MPEKQRLTRTELRKRKQIYFRRRVLVAVIFILFIMLIYFILSGIVSLFTKGSKTSSSSSSSKASSSSSSSVSQSPSQNSSSSEITVPSEGSYSQVTLQANTAAVSLDNLKQSSEWNLLLVSSKFILSPGFKVTTAKSTQIDAVMDSRIIESLDKMVAEAKKNQIYLASSSTASSYRSQADSQKLFDNKVNEFVKQGMTTPAAQVEALKSVPQPGTSEHDAGLGLDLQTQDYLSGKIKATDDLSNVKEYVWLKNNCANYGFIPRYPKDKVSVTGVDYEPFHYRYVGAEHAKKIMKNNLCLEEYLIKLQNGEKLE